MIVNGPYRLSNQSSGGILLCEFCWVVIERFNDIRDRETLEDGSIIIVNFQPLISFHFANWAWMQLGGCKNGGYINDAAQSNPTYEFFPPNGPSISSPFLQNTLPANLYPLTWLLPSGKIFLQATWSTTLLDYRTKVETPLDDMPDAIRTYPASAGTTMMPLTPANNWTATIMFCGGSDVASDLSVVNF